MRDTEKTKYLNDVEREIRDLASQEKKPRASTKPKSSRKSKTPPEVQEAIKIEESIQLISPESLDLVQSSESEGEGENGEEIEKKEVE